MARWLHDASNVQTGIIATAAATIESRVTSRPDFVPNFDSGAAIRETNRYRTKEGSYLPLYCRFEIRVRAPRIHVRLLYLVSNGTDNYLRLFLESESVVDPSMPWHPTGL